MLTGGGLPTSVVVGVVIVLALSALIKAATPLATIILHKFRPEPGRRIQVERGHGRLKIVIEPQEEPKPNDTPQERDKQPPPTSKSADGAPQPKPKRPAKRRL